MGDYVKPCYFCESDVRPQHEHHIIPKKIEKYVEEDNTKTVTLCFTCHLKLHNILRPLEKYIIIERKEKVDAEFEKELEEMKIRNMEAKSVLLCLGENIMKRSELVESLNKTGMDREKAEKLIDWHWRNATIYTPRPGYYKVTD